MGIWSLSVLRQPGVQAAFENQGDPLAKLLPMASHNESPNAGATQGLFKQLIANKVVLAVAGGYLLVLLLVPLLFFFSRSSKNQPNVFGPNPVSTHKEGNEELLIGEWKGKSGAYDIGVVFHKAGGVVLRQASLGKEEGM